MIATFHSFEPAHFDELVLREEDAKDLQGIDRAMLMELWSNGTTAMNAATGKVACIYGVNCQGETACMWLLTSREIEKYPVFFTHTACTFIDALFENGIFRIELYCHADNTRSLKWLTRLLRFRIEGMSRQCGPNRQDRFILSRLATDT